VQRKHLGLSLQQVADQAGISVGHLSQLERGLSSPSVQDLAQIARVLKTTIGEFLNVTTVQDTDPIVVRLAQRGVTSFGDRIVKQLLTPPGESPLKMFMVTLEPEGNSGESTFTHAGIESGLVLQGRLHLIVDNQEFLLNEGDSFRFASNRPHKFANIFAGATRVLWVNAMLDAPAPDQP